MFDILSVGDLVIDNPIAAFMVPTLFSLVAIILIAWRGYVLKVRYSVKILPWVHIDASKKTDVSNTLHAADEKVLSILSKELSKHYRVDGLENIILIRYGSSVYTEKYNNDYDYIVLVIGFEEDRYLQSLGKQIDYINNKERIDLEIRDFNSFLFSASAGYPYETSIINTGIFIYGQEGYYKWLRHIVGAIVVDTHYLRGRLLERSYTVLTQLDGYLEDRAYKKHKYPAIIRLYSIYSFYYQYLLLDDFGGITSPAEVSKFASPYNFKESLSISYLWENYEEIVQCFKRRRLPVGDADALILHWSSEIKSVILEEINEQR